MARRAASNIILLMSSSDITDTNRLLYNNRTNETKTSSNSHLINRALQQRQLSMIRVPYLISSNLLIGLSRNQQLISTRRTNLLTRNQTSTTNSFKRIINRKRAIMNIFPLTLASRIIPLKGRIARQTSNRTRQNTAVRTTNHLHLNPQLRTNFNIGIRPILSALLGKTFDRLSTNASLRRSSQITRIDTLLPWPTHAPFPEHQTR